MLQSVIYARMLQSTIGAILPQAAIISTVCQPDFSPALPLARGRVGAFSRDAECRNPISRSTIARAVFDMVFDDAFQITSLSWRQKRYNTLPWSATAPAHGPRYQLLPGWLCSATSRC